MSTGMNSSSENADRVRSSAIDLNLDRKESTAGELLKFAGTWQGDDLEKCLEEVYKTRGETTF